ncbi:MAG: lipopolysaccharide heptosyltransferase family protein [Proteobacteria bacterium]|nr:lipopolysaccharide heptosyltransferase family protein [Pseudomonadota bacterium]
MIKVHHIVDWWWNRRRRAPRTRAASGVLLISSGGLGDTVLFAHVAERFQGLARDDEQVTVLLRSDAMKMAFLLPSGFTVKGVDFKKLRNDLAYRREVTDEIFNAHYRLVVHTDYLRHPDLDEALVAAAHAEEAVAMEPRPWRKYDARLNRNRGLYRRLFDSGPANLNKVLRWSNFANWLLGTETPPPRALLPVSTLPPPADDGPAVIIQPFSAVKQKQSPPALYRRIIKSLAPGTRVAVTGTQGDLDGNSDFQSLLDLPGVEFDSSNFQQLVPQLRAAKLVISVDTALMHLAVAVGAPTLCLASAAYVGEIVPYEPAIAPDNARFVYHSMDCEGCLGNCIHPPEDGMFPCVARLDEADILAQVRDLAGGR